MLLFDLFSQNKTDKLKNDLLFLALINQYLDLEGWRHPPMWLMMVRLYISLYLNGLNKNKKRIKCWDDSRMLLSGGFIGEFK